MHKFDRGAGSSHRSADAAAHSECRLRHRAWWRLPRRAAAPGVVRGRAGRCEGGGGTASCGPPSSGACGVTHTHTHNLPGTSPAIVSCLVRFPGVRSLYGGAPTGSEEGHGPGCAPRPARLGTIRQSRRCGSLLGRGSQLGTVPRGAGGSPHRNTHGGRIQGRPTIDRSSGAAGSS